MCVYGCVCACAYTSNMYMGMYGYKVGWPVRGCAKSKKIYIYIYKKGSQLVCREQGTKGTSEYSYGLEGKASAFLWPAEILVASRKNLEPPKYFYPPSLHR